MITRNWQAELILEPSKVVAVMIALPSAIAVTIPRESTVAILSFDVPHSNNLLVALAGEIEADSTTFSPLCSNNSLLFRETDVTLTIASVTSIL